MQRRHFIRQTSMTALGLGVLSATPVDLLAKLRSGRLPDQQLRIGLIGRKGMGWANLTSFLKMKEVTCLAICDIDQTVIDQRLADLAKLSIKADSYTDYRKLLERKDIDAVIIATPDHWHCLQMADACAAGKQVYVEKPAANSIGEAELMVKIAQKHKSIVQVNQWQRSQQHFKEAIAFVKSGKLGTIAQAKAWMYNGHGILPPANDTVVPKGVDYKMWLGPAPDRPFNPNRFHYNFRWYWDYAGGLMTDWGVHLIDMVLMGLNPELPQSVVSMGGHIAYPTDARETPDTQTALYNYNGFQLTWEHTMGRQYGLYGMGHGIAFIGDKGTLLLNRGGWEVKPEMQQGKPLMEAIAWQKQGDNGLDLHTRNFLEAVNAGNASLLNCPIEAGAKSAVHCHLGNVAYRTGEKITASGLGQQGIKPGIGEQYVLPTYHNGWQLPQQ